MKLGESKVIGEGKSASGRVYMTLYEQKYEHGGVERPYFVANRGSNQLLHGEKQPDAVVVVGVLHDPNGRKSLVVTSEFRVPIGGRELSFPAGMIDSADFEGGGDIFAAARRAAVREFKEETGLDLEVTEFSPPHIYSSAGMTNESVVIVFGVATGTPSVAGCEATEDISILLLDDEAIRRMIDEPDNSEAYSKVLWPFLWGFSRSGL